MVYPCPFLLGVMLMAEFLTKEEHTEFSKRMDKENEIQNARLNALERAVEDITKITINLERLATSVEQVVKELEKQGHRLDAIEDTPKKRWETIVAAIIAGIVGFALNGIITGAFR